jgi:hypothetical protein
MVVGDTCSVGIKVPADGWDTACATTLFFSISVREARLRSALQEA